MTLSRARTISIYFTIFVFHFVCLYLFVSSMGFAKDRKESPSSQILCPQRIEIQGMEEIHFTDLEMTLVCGDEDVKAWQEIPFNQARYHLKVFLQDRGFYQPDFTFEENRLKVQLGPPTSLSQVEVLADPPFWDIRKKRKILGQRLTPRLIDEVENWIKGQLKTQGHPCPSLSSEADPIRGTLKIELERGPRQLLNSITQESVPGLGAGTLRRYDAFEWNKPFNENLLELTSRRLQQEGLFQSSHFTWSCPGSGSLIDLFQEIIPGKPRLFTLGFGFDTQEYGILKASWRHSRWGKKASQLNLNFYGSYRQQDLNLSSDWYAFAPLSRWFLKPDFNVHHERTSQFQYLSLSSQISLSHRYDNQTLSLQNRFGPHLNFTRTFKGAEEKFTHFSTFQYELNLSSHDWEFWQTNPRQGSHLHFIANFGHKKIFSDITAQRFSLSGQYLYNLKGYDPPLLIFGVRGGFYGTFVKDNPQTLAKLPPNYRFYLGGTRDLRGFGYQEIPAGPGALSALWAGGEIRLSNTLPFWIEPLIFLDAGILGDRAFHFQRPLYLSPGGGFRIASPIGVFRLSLAEGLKIGRKSDGAQSHFQFLLSYGEEF